MGTSYNPRIVTDGLILCLDAANKRSYPGVGTNFVDLSHLKNTTTLVNNPTYNNNYFSFDGTDDHIILSDSSSVDVSSEKTFEMWVRFNTFSNENIAISLFNKRLTSGGGAAGETEYFIFIWIGSAGVANQITFDYGLGVNRWTTGYVPPLNEWVHIVLNVNTILPKRNLYINGKLQVSDTSSIPTITTYSNDVFISKNNIGNNDYYLNGDIGLVKIYNRYLSNEEITQNYLATKGRFQ